MGSGIFFPLSAIPFSILIMFLFFKKEHIQNIETRLYKVLIITNFIGLILELLCTYASSIYETNPLLSDIIYKSYLVYLLCWTAVFTYYVYKVSATKLPNWNNAKKFLGISLCVIINLIVYLLPIEVVIKNNFQIRYTTGISVMYTYAVSSILVIIMLVILFKNRRNIKRKKYIPVFVFFVVGTIAIVVQLLEPQLLLITYVETFICVIMYFTIENPDMKLLNEFVNNKKLTETSIEEKSNLLFQVSQEVKKPLMQIFELSSAINKSNDKNEIKDKSSEIETISRNVTEVINNVLDISQMDKQNIKITNNTYNIYKLLKEIIYLTKNKYREEGKNIDFKYSISNTMPEILYGDSLKLKQVICSILFNAFANTEDGYIDLDVAHIVKYDVCRLIISISDSGSGMELEKINEILTDSREIDEKELNKISNLDVDLKLSKKIIDLLGGALLIKSELNKGTTFTIIINQIIEMNTESNQIKSLAENLSNKKKVLLIDNDYLELDKFSYELKMNSLEVVSTMYGQDCIEKLENKEKFDLILVDDELENFNALDILKGIKKLKIKNLKVVIMLEKEKEFMKQKFLNDYPFTDYLLKENYKDEIKRIKDTYL